MQSEGVKFLVLSLFLVALTGCKGGKVDFKEITWEIVDKDAIGDVTASIDNNLIYLTMSVSNSMEGTMSMDVDITGDNGSEFSTSKESTNPMEEIRNKNLCESVEAPSDDEGLPSGTHVLSGCDISSFLQSLSDGQKTLTAVAKANDNVFLTVTVKVSISSI